MVLEELETQVCQGLTVLLDLRALTVGQDQQDQQDQAVLQELQGPLVYQDLQDP